MFPPNNAICGENGGGGNRTRVQGISDYAVLRDFRGGRPSVEVEDGVCDTPCWLWLGCLNSKGYPVRGTKNGRYLVHRRVFEEAGGVLAPGEQTHHRCKTRHCVNPDHLSAHTQLDHSREHAGGGTLAERAIELLGDGTARNVTTIAAALNAQRSTVGVVLHRAVARGEITKVARGIFTTGARA